jgi:hypothetical protein
MTPSSNQEPPPTNTSYEDIMRQFYNQNQINNVELPPTISTQELESNNEENIEYQEHFTLELPDKIFGNVMKTDLDIFEKDYIEIAKSKVIDKTINNIIDTLYNVHFDITSMINIDDIIRLQKQKTELEKVIDKVDNATKLRFENNIKEYDNKIASLINISITETKKKNLINKLKPIKTDIDLSNIKNDMISIKKYIDELEQKLINNTGSNKDDLLFCFSAILILFRNINEWILCF